MQARVTIPNDGTRGQRRAHTSGMRSLHTVADQLNPCGLGRCVAGATRHRKMGPLCRDCLVCRRGSLYEWLCGVNAHRPRSPCMPMRLARGPILTRSRTERTHDAPGRLRLCCIITIADTVCRRTNGSRIADCRRRAWAAVSSTRIKVLHDVSKSSTTRGGVLA